MLKGRIAQLKKKYPIGSRIRLIKMDDLQAPPLGTKGTIIGVDVIDLVDEVELIKD